MGLLGWAFFFLILAATAALLGFTRVAVGAVLVARILFGVFLFLFLVFMLVFALAGLGGGGLR